MPAARRRLLSLVSAAAPFAPAFEEAQRKRLHSSPLGGIEGGAALKDELLEEPEFVAIAQRHGKTVAQVLLKWQVQRGVITIAKSFTPSRIVENAELFSWELSEAEMEVLASHDACWRAVVPVTPHHLRTALLVGLRSFTPTALLAGNDRG